MPPRNRDRDNDKGLRDALRRYEKMFAGGAPEDPMGPEQVESREFHDYKEAERRSRQKIWYERLVRRTSFFSFTFEDMEEDHRNAIRLLDWDIEPDQIGPAATVVTLLVTMAVVPFLLIAGLPALLSFFIILIPIVTFYYMIQYPMLKAKQKVISASSELIQAVLYMVIYMRSSPYLEGAVAFASQHLTGTISDDMKDILWKIDVHQYNNVDAALKDYVDRWKPYNKGFVEAISLVTSATHEANAEKRNEILDEAIDRLLGYTRDQMDEFAASLKLPVMVLYGLGILLPVLGTILFPLVATFMGGGGTVIYLALLYNIILPGATYLLMINLLMGRPVSFSSKSGELSTYNPGKLAVNLFGKKMKVSMFVVSIPLFLILVYWPATHYWPIIVGDATMSKAPGPITLFREIMILFAVAIPAGVHMIYGYKDVLVKQKEVEEMESEFPEVLFELSNLLDRGQPIEIAVGRVGEQTGGLSITRMFDIITHNIQANGMTFKDAVFDDNIGAIKQYPSQMIATIMEVVSESAEKGTRIAAKSTRMISQYLKNISETQKKLEEMVGDTLSSLKFLAFVLAPVIAGIAVGMGSVITLSFAQIGGTINQTTPDAPANGSEQLPGQGGGPNAGAEPPSITSIFNFENAIPPGLLQLVVGIYLIELALIIGMLYVRLKDGENKPRRYVVTGKILISSIIFYTITVMIIVTIFGGMIRGVTT